MQKRIMINSSLWCCVLKFPQVQYIDLSEIVNVMKAVAIVSSLHLNVSMIFVVSHFFSAKVSPEKGVKPGMKSPFPLNKNVPSIEVTDIKIMWTFFPDQILCPLKWKCSRRGATVFNLFNV